jgi:hypothetical protein
MPYGKLLSGPVGYMHMDGCLFNAVEAAALRAASRALSKPARSVGSSTWAGTAAVQLFQVSRLLVKHGRFVSRVRHDEAHLPAGTVLPQRAGHRPRRYGAFVPAAAGGPDRPSQRVRRRVVRRPHASVWSGHACGRTNGGGCGLVRSVTLAPGWSIFVASRYTDLGPDEWQLSRIDGMPDIRITPTPGNRGDREIARPWSTAGSAHQARIRLRQTGRARLPRRTPGDRLPAG